jgi:hypothetical protein
MASAQAACEPGTLADGARHQGYDCARRVAPCGRLAQLGEHFPYKEGVTGSSPVPPITESPAKAVELPSQLAALLNKHYLASEYRAPGDFVFCTRTGKALCQRNVGRELRRAQREARTPQGDPTFPILHQRDEDGNRVKVPLGAVPSFHSFRHSAASEAIAQGASAEELSFQLGHRNPTVTRSIYIREVKSSERSARRRNAMEERYGGLLEKVAQSPRSRPLFAPNGMRASPSADHQPV